MPQVASSQIPPPHANVSTSTTRRTLFQPTLSRRPASSTSNTSHNPSSTSTSRPATATSSRPNSRASRAKQHPSTMPSTATDQLEIVPRDAMGRYAVPALMTTTLPSPEGDEDGMGLEEREKEEKARIDNARAHMLNARWRGYGGWEEPEMEEVVAMVWERLRDGVRKADAEMWMFGLEEGEARGGAAWGTGEEG